MWRTSLIAADVSPRVLEFRKPRHAPLRVLRTASRASSAFPKPRCLRRSSIRNTFRSVPVYHFTLHAYRSWSPGHRRGYVQRNKGVLKRDCNMASRYDTRANFEAVAFTDKLQEILVLGTHEVCRRKGWRLHAVATDASHFHCVLSWNGFLEWAEVRKRIKNVLSRYLGIAQDQPGRQWFVREGSRKRVTDRKHLDHLLTTYLPDHRGLCWSEGQTLPPDRFGLLEIGVRD